VRAFLELPDGVRVRIGPEGLLVGRHRSCDVQLADESASRRHALLRVAPEGVELVVLGRQPVHVADKPCTSVQLLAPDESLRFPGFTCTVRVEEADEPVRVDHALRRGRDRVPIKSSPFVVGGGASARVVIAGWPDEALRFTTAQGELYVEVGDAGATHNGNEVAAGTPVQLARGDELAYRGETFAIDEANAGDASTVVTPTGGRPAGATLEPLPRGGRVRFAFVDGERSVYLPGRRYRLVSALLQPPAPHAAGDFIPDAELVPVVWNDDDEVGGRQDINVLLTRCRQDLVAAGIAPAGLLERAPGGRATRIVLAPNAQIRLAE
jgi:hypothetical protein